MSGVSILYQWIIALVAVAGYVACYGREADFDDYLQPAEPLQEDGIVEQGAQVFLDSLLNVLVSSELPDQINGITFQQIETTGFSVNGQYKEAYIQVIDNYGRRWRVRVRQFLATAGLSEITTTVELIGAVSDQDSLAGAIWRVPDGDPEELACISGSPPPPPPSPPGSGAVLILSDASGKADEILQALHSRYQNPNNCQAVIRQAQENFRKAVMPDFFLTGSDTHHHLLSYLLGFSLLMTSTEKP